MDTLQACMEQQNVVLQAFLQALDEESQAMNEGRFKDLPALIERKNRLTTQLAQLDQASERLQQQTRFNPIRCTDPALTRAWQLLREQTAQARERNYRNAVTTHTLLDFTRQAIATLQGGAGLLYGSNGLHPRGVGQNKSLGHG